MGLATKLKSWEKAGLISTDQRRGIEKFEHDHSAGRWKFGVGFAGILSILLGIALMVAANWQEIPWQLKIGLHFTVNAVLTGLVWQWRADHTRDMHREVALFALWGFTLTFIALIGQVFQLGGHAYTALRVWFWLTTPMILLFAQSRYIARLWAVAFMFYVPYDLIASTWDATDDWTMRKAVLLGTGIILPIGAWLAGMWPRFAVNRPTVTETLRGLAILMALAGASLAGLEFYDSRYGDYSVIVPIVFAVIVVLARFALYPRLQDTQARNTFDVLCLAGLFMCIPFMSPVDGSFLSMIHFIAFWLLAGALWQQAGENRLVSLAIVMITIRLFIGFLELFGSLMMSGFGFIAIGVVLIVLVKIARWLNTRLKGSDATAGDA